MKRLLLAVAAGTLSFAAQAQVPQYGTSINLEQARKAIAAGQAEARKNSWPVAIAFVDTAGNLVAYEKMDNTQTASILVAIDKGRSAAIYRRPTKVFEDLVAKGGAGVRALNLRDAQRGRRRPADRGGRQGHRRHRGQRSRWRPGRDGREGGRRRAEVGTGSIRGGSTRSSAGASISPAL